MFHDLRGEWCAFSRVDALRNLLARNGSAIQGFVPPCKKRSTVLWDADYGGGVIKQRIARPNEGKSGGYRSIIIFQRGDRSFFVYGFAKNELANIDKSDERDFKELAERLLSATDENLRKLMGLGEFVEVNCHEQD